MDIILLIAAIFGFVLSSLLFFKKSTYTKATFFLGCFYFIISVYAIHTYIIDSGCLYKFQWFFLWPLLPYHLIFVPIYFYFIAVIKDRFYWKNTYLLLFVPFLLGIVDVVAVYVAPKPLYNQLIDGAITDKENRLDAHYWLLSLNEHYIMRHIWQLGALLIILPKLRLFLKEENTYKLKKTLNKWLMFFWTILLLMALLTILHGLENLMHFGIFSYFFGIENGILIVTFILYFIIFIIGIIPIYFPTILYGYPRATKLPASNNKVMEPAPDLKFGLHESDIKNKLEVLEQKKVFLGQDFTVTKCAQEIQIPAHHLSYFINEFYGQTFTAYKNQLRMEHAKQLLSNGFLERSTMEALAWECGFANRSSFSKAFKTATTQSPSEYVLNSGSKE